MFCLTNRFHVAVRLFSNRELKQTRRRRRRERHLKMWLRVSAIIFQLFILIKLEKCVLTILELNWNQRLGHNKTKLNICHHMLPSSTQLQNRSFHVVERRRTYLKCQKMRNARAKRAKILFFIVKYANLWGFCCRRRRGCLSSLLLGARDGTAKSVPFKLNSTLFVSGTSPRHLRLPHRVIEKLKNNAWHYKNRKKLMENSLKCHWTLKNVRTFRTEPFISVNGLFYTDEGLCPKRWYIF